MASEDDKPEPTVKELLERDLGEPLEAIVDELTASQLERWFGLPSFEQVEDGGERAAPEEDPEMLAVRERRAKAIAAVDPDLLESHRLRVEPPRSLIQFEAILEVRVDPDLALFDLAMVEGRIAEPRELERPEDIEDQLRDNTPQALLRDLHRAELEFQKEFEVVDMSAEQRIDAVAAVREAISTSWKLPELGEPPGRMLARFMAELRAEREAPWAELPKRVHLPNRQVEE